MPLKSCYRFREKPFRVLVMDVWMLVGDAVDKPKPTVDGKRNLLFTRSHAWDYSAAHVLPGILLSH